MGKRVRKARMRMKMTQRELCIAVHMTEGSYRAIENGQCEPRAPTLRRLCQELGTTADHLLFGTAA